MNVALALLAPILILPHGPADDAPTAAEFSPIARELLDAHNRVRAEHDLPPFTLEAKLGESALVHARDMAEHENMAHEGSDGSTPGDRVRRAGYRFRRTAENVAYGQRTVDRVLDAWMNSPEHRKNILGDFTEIGAARAEDSDGRPYWAVSFGTPIPRLDPDEAAADLIARLNDLRTEAGKRKLEPSPPLNRAARTVVDRLAAADAGPGQGETNDLGAAELAQRAGYRFLRLQSTSARGTATAEELVESLNADEAVAAVLLADFRHLGVAYARSEEETPYWVIILGTPQPRR